MFKSQDVVLVDTNVLIEAHRIGCLAAIANFFALHTVETVVVETQTGYHQRRKEETINEGWLREHLKHVAMVSDEQLFEFTDTRGDLGLHAGEMALIIYAESLPDKNVWFLNSPDMAAVRYAVNRGWHERLVSLEAMCGRINAKPKLALRGNFTEDWLGKARTDLVMKLLKKP